MDLWLAYNIALTVGLVIALAWAYDARRFATRVTRLARLSQDYFTDLPTEELELPPTMRIAPAPRLEEFGPGKPLPPDWAA